MARKRDGNYLWVSWLATLMAGETQCQWGAWFRTHYTDWAKVPDGFQVAQWQAQHTQLLSELAAERAALGERTYRENQNSFRLRAAPALTLAGKPDLVAINPTGQATVYDAKTGQPSQGHLIQVLLYMLCLPSASPIHKGRSLNGCLAYANGDRTTIPAEAVSPEFKRTARYFVDLLNADDAPARVPSHWECQMCGIGLPDCPERVDETDDGEAPALDWS